MKRIALIDILRGIAILGTLGTNIWIFAHLGDLKYITTTDFMSWSSMDDILRILVLFAFNGKLLGMLTIMFGVGMAIKYEQSIRHNKPWGGMYKWVIAFLMVEGLLHYVLVMEYDVLMSYAVTAGIIAVILKRGERAITRVLWGAGALHLGMLALIFISMLLGPAFSMASSPQLIAIYSEGTWLEQVQNRLTNFMFFRTESIFIIPLNICLFIIGIKLLRSGAFSFTEQGIVIQRKLLTWGLGLGLPLNALTFVPGGLFDLPVRYLFAPVLALGYLGLIAFVVRTYSTWGVWKWLEKTGRMSLSCYILQNITATSIFYGWGLGLGGNLNSMEIIGVFCMIVIGQIILANVWLAKFPNGPVEWLRKGMLQMMQR
ncbi:DUF418 domain-containing protein [Lysinibacillus sp. SGAir0095]|uniref:DUF418 domain-containing protein n=1 Tax=Lysinibacillus sp. SGAir0095 TaxID=2070463 RepID=UPI0010CD4F32|nr:DUF418 domain-containing protein [Lysinibacillus sp. SGAir0095]QCR31127.1 DUF418 domain-containing protein [Lysinibacillus sp. SGAir0095]